MRGSAILEVALGVVVYLLVSSIGSPIREGIESSTKTRTARLGYGIRERLMIADGQGLAMHLSVSARIFAAGHYEQTRTNSCRRQGEGVG